jgi:hypothetical protein
MNRGQFLKGLFGAASVVTVAPNVLAAEPKKAVLPMKPIEIDVSPDGLSIEEFIKAWREQGVLIYKNSPSNVHIFESKDGTYEIHCPGDVIIHTEFNAIRNKVLRSNFDIVAYSNRQL